MTIAELIEKLKTRELHAPVCIETRIKTGYDEGTLYESIDIEVREFEGRVILRSAGYRIAGGW